MISTNLDPPIREGAVDRTDELPHTSPVAPRLPAQLVDKPRRGQIIQGRQIALVPDLLYIFLNQHFEISRQW
jgi:hypothetical protein